MCGQTPHVIRLLQIYTTTAWQAQPYHYLSHGLTAANRSGLTIEQSVHSKPQQLLTSIHNNSIAASAFRAQWIG
jgi:hypothetical protein